MLHPCPRGYQAGACARALNGGTARSRRESVFHSARIGFPRLVFCACGAGIGANDPSANPFSKQLDKETLAAQKVNECKRLVQQLSVNSQVLGGPFLLLQLRVLRLGFFQDGDVGIGVFP
jgi:hypothetical protein